MVSWPGTGAPGGGRGRQIGMGGLSVGDVTFPGLTREVSIQTPQKLLLPESSTGPFRDVE